LANAPKNLARAAACGAVRCCSLLAMSMHDKERTRPAWPDASSGRASESRLALRSFMLSSPWAAGLRSETIDRLWVATTVRELQPAEVLGRQGELSTHWYGIMRGLLRMDRLCEHGNVISLAAGPMGTWFGEAMLVLREPRNYEVSSMRSSMVACVSASVFRATLKEDAQFNDAILRMLSNRVRAVTDLFAQQRGLDPQRHIARILVSMIGQGRHGPILQVDVSQEELAQLAGVARQRVNQALRSLQLRGLIETSYASVVVRDLRGLAEI
jgi:CRP/FNR family transcriptional regulator, cyclic AMP receptor protein